MYAAFILTRRRSLTSGPHSGNRHFTNDQTKSTRMRTLTICASSYIHCEACVSRLASDIHELRRIRRCTANRNQSQHFFKIAIAVRISEGLEARLRVHVHNLMHASRAAYFIVGVCRDTSAMPRRYSWATGMGADSSRSLCRSCRLSSTTPPGPTAAKPAALPTPP